MSMKIIHPTSGTGSGAGELSKLEILTASMTSDTYGNGRFLLTQQKTLDNRCCEWSESAHGNHALPQTSTRSVIDEKLKEHEGWK
eukprot:scaffold3907_cov76-Skeletonema_dohrnii-CCMP3373.AAC.4